MRLVHSKLFVSCAALVLSAGGALAQQRQEAPSARNQQDQAQRAIGEEARNCLTDVQRFNDRLTEAGYGYTGPAGYVGAPGWRTYGGLSTPRGEMRTLSNAAYILAVNDNAEGCRMVLKEMSDLYETRGERVAQGARVPREQLSDWRRQRLQAAIPVEDAKATIRADEILGADVRNMRDERLGDVEDIILGPDGGMRYVLISRGGFLGFGGELVPVRWQDLRITPEPNRDTLVLPVDETALEQAPKIEDIGQGYGREWRERVDAFWGERVRD